MADADFFRSIILTTNAYRWGKITLVEKALRKWESHLRDVVIESQRVIRAEGKKKKPLVMLNDDGSPLIGDVYGYVRIAVQRSEIFSRTQPRGNPKPEDWNDVLAWLAVEKFLPGASGS